MTKMKICWKLPRDKTMYQVIPPQMPRFIALRAERHNEELVAVNARQRSAPSFSLNEGLFFLPLSPAPPFPLIAASASDCNLLEKNPRASCASPAPAVADREILWHESRGLFLPHFEHWFTHTNGPTFNHMGNTFNGWNCCDCFPKYDPKEEELVMESYALKMILQMNMLNKMQSSVQTHRGVWPKWKLVTTYLRAFTGSLSPRIPEGKGIHPGSCT